ncbi:MAG TPA: alpha/beta fold hydrolase [Reyranella sp.]|jgi:pimeloyl-ACP methyl ester carboxylesterase|nr:alpha/beta fold hydrolase [Reyranella sp.]
MASQFHLVGRIAVDIETPTGAGEAALCIHGLGGTSNTWTPLLPALSRFTTVRFDLPGSGRSHRAEGMLSIFTLVEACLRVLASRRIERAHVLGHSLGTIIALHLAAREPKMVRSLALFGPLLAPPDVARAGIKARAEKARREGDAGMQAIADSLVQAATSAETRARRPAVVAYVRESLMRQDPDGYARTCEALAEAKPADAAAIVCPTLLVTGDEDGVAPPHAVRALGSKIAGSQVEVLRGCGHWTPLEKADECIDLLRRFYARRGSVEREARHVQYSVH